MIMISELLVSILTQAGPATQGNNIWVMVTHAGLMVKLVLLVLLAFSVISWTIIIYKSYQIRRARRESYYFLKLFWKSRSLASIYNESRRFEASPVAPNPPEVLRRTRIKIGLTWVTPSNVPEGTSKYTR